MIFLFWLMFAVLAGMLAHSRGRSFAGVFLLSLLLSPLVGFIYVLVVKPLPTEAEREMAAVAAANSRKCPYCAETIKAEAIVCRFCGREVPRQENAMAEPLPPVPTKVPVGIWIMFAVLITIIVVVLIAE